MAQLLAPLKLRQHLLFLDELVPDADRASAYTRFCNELWTRLQQQGVAVLELGSDEEFSAFASALETCAVFFAADEPVKQGAQSSVLGEGYAIRPGKELLAVRPGAPAWGSGRSRTQHAALQKASSRADRLCRGLLCALCRSPGLDVHSGRVLGLLDDAPLLGQASASLLRCARYSPDPHAAQLLAFAPHHDRGVLTLVASAQEQGLQVQLPQQGQGAGAGAGAWVDVPLGPGRVAVLCGYSLSYALGGLLQPALHRVRPVAVAACGGAAGRSAATAGGGRVSLAYELCFRPNACVDPAAITQGAAEQLPAAAAAAGEGGAASRPALLTSALMERFEATHPVSINGGVRVKQEQPRAQQEPAARRQREEANLVSDGGQGEQKPAAAAAAAGRSGAQAQRAAGQGWAAVANAAAEGLQSASQAPPSDATKQQQQRRTSLRLQQQQQNSRQDAPAPALTGTATKQPVGTSGGGSSKEREQQAPAGATARHDAGAAAANGGAAGVSAAARRQREENRTAAGVEAPEAKRGRHGRVPAVDQHAGSPAAAPTALSQPAPAGGSGHGGQAEAPAEGQHGDGRINIIIKDQSGSEVHFQVKQTTQLQQVFDAYCNKKGLDILKLRFIYNGNRVLYGTVGERGVQDGGIIDSVLEQIGS